MAVVAFLFSRRMELFFFKLLFPTAEVFPQRVLGAYMVECRVFALGIRIMIWGSIPHNST